MKFSSSACTFALLALSSSTSVNAFTPLSTSATRSSTSTSTSLNIVVGDTKEEFAVRLEETFKKAPSKDPDFEDVVQTHFPGALSNEDMVTDAVALLAGKGYNGSNTLLATSLCCDELARQLEDDFNGIYGNNFNLGGLAGFPFAGNTGFGAMAAHIPDDGYCLIVYGPHVGVNSLGVVGQIDRRGRPGSGACCGSAAAAAGYVAGVTRGESAPVGAPTEAFDAQQMFVGTALLPYGDRLETAEEPGVELPLALFDGMDKMMKKIVAAGCGEVGGNGKIALLGGVQINTPEGTCDYFLPKVFEIRNNKGEIIESFDI